jgi:hypothetical protein
MAPLIHVQYLGGLRHAYCHVPAEMKMLKLVGSPCRAWSHGGGSRLGLQVTEPEKPINGQFRAFNFLRFLV